MMRILILMIIFFFNLPYGIGQPPETSGVAAAVQLDSVVIKATKQGFNIDDFVELVQTDDTFYKAFKNLRKSTYKFDVDMSFQNKKEKQRARYNAENIQIFENGCRRMNILKESFEGNFYKKKKNPKYRYYTAKLYHRLFCTDGVVCEQEDRLPDNSTIAGIDEETKTMEGHVNQLKKLMFSPGQQANVPFIKKKTAIFSDRMRKFYDFKISSETHDNIPCYVFTASVKPQFEKQPGRTVIKYLSTKFSKSDFQVLSRSYRLEHGTVAFRFDVSMDIDLIKQGSTYFPKHITYDGFWNVAFKNYEKGTFTVSFSDFE